MTRLRTTFSVRWKPNDGAPGQGVRISASSVRYASSASGTVRPQSGWGENVPQTQNGQYLWTWVRVVYSDGNSTDSYSVSRMGIDGKGIKSSVVTYCQKANTNVAPENFPASDWGGFPSTLTDGYWLYTKTHIVYSDNATTDSYSVSQVGVGAYFAGCNEYYATSAGKDTPPSGYPEDQVHPYVNGVATYGNGDDPVIGSAWNTARPTTTTDNPYVWNFEISYDSRGNKYVTEPICIGNFAKGITGMVETYAISAYGVKPYNADYPLDIDSWTDEAHAAAPTDAKPFQWNRTQVTYNDSTVDTFYHVSAVKGIGACVLHLDNENDSMLYDGQGNLVSGPVVSNIVFYANGTIANPQPQFSVVTGETSTFVAASVTGTVLTVTGISGNNLSGFVTVRCDYLGTTYKRRMTVKRLINKDKYEIKCTPSALVYNATTEEGSLMSRVIVYRTTVAGQRTNIARIPVNWKLYVDGEDCTSSYNTNQGYHDLWVQAATHDVVVTLRDDSDVMQDSQSIPVTVISNGGQGIPGPSGPPGQPGPQGKDTLSVYQAAYVQPSEPSGDPSDWDDTCPWGLEAPVLATLEFTHDGDWFPQQGWNRAPFITHGEVTKQRVMFVTPKANMNVYILLSVKSETSCDYIAVGRLDQDAPENAESAYLDRLSGSDGAIKLVTVNVPAAGAHSVGISFFKNSSQTVAGEYAMYKIGRMTVWESHVLTRNANGFPLTWSAPMPFSAGEDSVSEPDERPNLLRLSEFGDDYQIGGYWNKHDGVISVGEFKGHNVFTGSNNDSSHHADILEQHVEAVLKPGRWYTLSFWAKGDWMDESGATLSTFFWPSATGHVNNYAGKIVDGVVVTSIGSDAWQPWLMTRNWLRHTFSFKTAASFEGEVKLLFRLMAGLHKTVFISCPKLEEGTVATGFRVNDADIAVMVVGESGFPDACGVYNPNRTYVWDNVKRQYVYHQIGQEYRAFFVRRKGMTVPVSTPPASGGNTYWEEGNAVSTLLTNTFIGANCNIGGFLASGDVLVSSNGRIIIDGRNNLVKVLAAVAGAVTAAMGDVNYPFFAGGVNGANARWCVDADGKMKSEDADINGKVSARSLTMPFGNMEEYSHTYSLDDPCNIVLGQMGVITRTLIFPDGDTAFDGRRVIVSWPPQRTAYESDHAVLGRIRCPNKDTGSTYYSSFFASRIDSAAGGIAEFICISGTWWLLNIHSNGVQYTQCM